MRRYMRTYYAENTEYVCRYQRERYHRKTAQSKPSPLAEARREHGYSQGALAEAIGTSQSTISRLESGALELEGFGKLDKLLAVLGVTV